MDYVTAKNKAEEWGITFRRVQFFCLENRINGIIRVGKMWLIPRIAKKPID